MKGKIVLITLGVSDFPRSLAFYLALGNERNCENDEAEFVMFRLEGTGHGWRSIRVRSQPTMQPFSPPRQRFLVPPCGGSNPPTPASRVLMIAL